MAVSTFPFSVDMGAESYARPQKLRSRIVHSEMLPRRISLTCMQETRKLGPHTNVDIWKHGGFLKGSPQGALPLTLESRLLSTRNVKRHSVRAAPRKGACWENEDSMAERREGSRRPDRRTCSRHARSCQPAFLAEALAPSMRTCRSQT